MDHWTLNEELFIAEHGDRVVDVVDLLAEPFPEDLPDPEGFESLVTDIRQRPGPLFHSLPDRELRFPLIDVPIPKLASGVYAVRCNEFVKIGKAVNMTRRMVSGSGFCPYPITFLGFVSRRTDDETIWHRRFAHLRWRGEWFYLGEQIAVWVRRITALSGALQQRIQLRS